MKRFILLMLTMLFSVTLVYAQGETQPATDYENVIASFAGFVGGIVLLVEAIKGFFPSMSGFVTQLVSWLTGIVALMLCWLLDAGFVAGLPWYIALAYGLGTSLVANGVADVGLVQWIIGLFSRKKSYR